ncbi:uncharacterized protein B0I36DRAFT_337793 [Microdochium trichocladiopsis]|uniref:Uncharacterized protein n=1 Tax=Microdochium trichocladiopsis TaxID=1682393 RepID=A0A9P8XV12_9PEZI|nr:uncharacterized protein B0I36DRAFT_337793 [Microdochium trichocladiopsis]KAH7016469.1 hypothetical protein B0I36DRAFT_337793 [Microdochium trichocladiopsis]
MPLGDLRRRELLYFRSHYAKIVTHYVNMAKHYDQLLRSHEAQELESLPKLRHLSVNLPVFYHGPHSDARACRQQRSPVSPTNISAGGFASEDTSFDDRSNTTTPLLQRSDPFLDLRVRSSPSCSSDSELEVQHGDCYPDPQHVKKEQDDLGNEDDATDFVQLGEGRC